MRNLIFILIPIFVFSSCEEFLKEDPKSFISAANFYENESDAKAAIAGAYASLEMNTTGRPTWNVRLHGTA
ncbi:MAG: hypothetical protein H6558_04580 [Lewinellaceae bacterium]|nr:hypothetical protein [Lewinellaceae bacterium]